MMKLFVSLEVALALGRVKIPEDVELVEGGENDEDEVPRDEDDAVLFVHLPPVDVRCHDQEYDRREQAERRVDQTWQRKTLKCIRKLFSYFIHRNW